MARAHTPTVSCTLDPTPTGLIVAARSAIADRFKFRNRPDGYTKRQVLAYTVIATCVVFAVSYICFLVSTLQHLPFTTGTWILVVVKTGIELIAGFYGIAFVLGAIAYLLIDERRKNVVAVRQDVRVGLLYLCCDDVDPSALESLATLSNDGAGARHSRR